MGCVASQPPTTTSTPVTQTARKRVIVDMATHERTRTSSSELCRVSLTSFVTGLRIVDRTAPLSVRTCTQRTSRAESMARKGLNGKSKRRTADFRLLYYAN